MNASRLFRRVVLALLTLATGLILAVPIPALAQQAKGKPGGGGTVPPGTIYFRYDNDIWGMKADGTGKALAFPNAGGLPISSAPSSLVYGPNRDDRWWLGFKTFPNQVYPIGVADRFRKEVVAYRYLPATGALQQVQVTNLFPGIEPGPDETHNIEWSNNGQDAFLSFKGFDWRAYEQTGNPADARIGLYRLHVSGAAIQAAANAGANLLLGPDALEVIFTSADTFSGNLTDHQWSPDGNQVVFNLRSPDDLLQDLYIIRDVAGGSVPVPLRQTNSNFSYRFRWSPDGSRLVMSDGFSVWMIDASTGQLLQTVYAGTTSAAESMPVWSPDSTQLCVEQRTLKGGTYRYDIGRLVATGGSLTSLASDLTVTTPKWPVGWVSNVTAGP